MPSPADIAAKFRSLDVHDDTVEGVTVCPGAKRGGKTVVTLTLFRHWEGTRRLLTLSGCANVAFDLDADVLRDNAPNNTSSLDATADIDKLQALMRTQRKSWNVSYEPTIDPLPLKLTNASKLVLFKVRLFGGNLRVAARSFSLKPAP